MITEMHTWNVIPLCHEIKRVQTFTGHPLGNSFFETVWIQSVWQHFESFDCPIVSPIQNMYYKIIEAFWGFPKTDTVRYERLDLPVLKYDLFPA